jgi:tRNA/tmRNA/rRNA uracil-C5-methylase (TrmA/RlmC/RlmD family)
MPFKPTDFTQVNPHINRVLVSRYALRCWRCCRTSA